MTLAELINIIKVKGIKEEDFNNVNIVIVNGVGGLTATSKLTITEKYDEITAYVYLK